ncbi:MAG: DUF4340 domain-containing protein [Gammaproteobacteria bacterium]|nr:DUF4340 domain-containing protein [Gammaproteobacteria bacterium]
MNRARGIINKTTLGALLAIQVVVVGVLLAARSGGIEEPEPFLEFDADSIDSLTVSNNEGSVDLSKVDGNWQLPNGVPAAGFKVDSVLERFSKAAGSWPVANTEPTRERFEVTEENHQRHIVARAGDDTVADIYLGTSPGYRKTHARRTGEDEIYAITFSNYEAGVKAADWLERSLLRPKGEVEALRRVPGDPATEPADPASDADTEEDGAAVETVAGFELSKDGGDSEDSEEPKAWVSADGSVLDQGKVETFVGRFKGLSVTGVHEAALPESATMTFVLTDEEGEQTLSVFSLDDGEKYVATSDRVPGAYELSKYIAEQMNKPLADLLPDPPEGEEAEESEPAPEPDADAQVAEESADESEDAEAVEASEDG